jgi:hypothetical protein
MEKNKHTHAHIMKMFTDEVKKAVHKSGFCMSLWEL